MPASDSPQEINPIAAPVKSINWSAAYLKFYITFIMLNPFIEVYLGTSAKKLELIYGDNILLLGFYCLCSLSKTVMWTALLYFLTGPYYTRIRKLPTKYSVVFMISIIVAPFIAIFSALVTNKMTDANWGMYCVALVMSLLNLIWLVPLFRPAAAATEPEHRNVPGV